MSSITSRDICHELAKVARRMPEGDEAETWEYEDEDGWRGVIEEGPNVRVTSSIIQIAIKEGCCPARIKQRGRRTMVTWHGSARLQPLVLPRFAAGRLALRFLNMMTITENDDLIVRGTIPIRYEEKDYTVRAALTPGLDGIVVDFEIEPE